MLNTTSLMNSLNDSLFPCLVNTAESLYGTGAFDIIEYRKNQIIYRDGSTPLGLYFVKCGYVKVFKTGIDGKEQILKLVGPGEFFGYKELMSDNRYASSASALENVEVYFIPKREFKEILSENTDFKNQFIMRLCVDLMETENKLVDLAYRPVRGRLADALLEMSEKHINEKNTIKISLSRDDLARLIGTAKETVIRLLSEFKREQLINTDGKMINLLNLNGLKRVSSMYA